jgi:protein-tyrosine phosphatase
VSDTSEVADTQAELPARSCRGPERPPRPPEFAARAAPVTEILLLCTANICRSPMAAALLTQELATRGIAAQVSSAGTLGSGAPPPAEVAAVMAGYGLDVAGHRSHLAAPGDLARADLVLAMAREHLRHAVVAAPDAWPRAFTLRELVRRGSLAGPRQPAETLAQWLSRVQAGRSRMALLGESAQDDVADPIGGPLGGYEQTAAELRHLVVGLADLCWTAPGAARHPAVSG